MKLLVVFGFLLLSFIQIVFTAWPSSFNSSGIDLLMPYPYPVGPTYNVVLLLNDSFVRNFGVSLNLVPQFEDKGLVAWSEITTRNLDIF